SVLDVIHVIDGPIRLNKCLEDSSPCTISGGACSCSFRSLWAELSEKVEQSLSAETFDKIMQK
ncbi:MAG: Rrf2 family transcriptional regulator, partial [Oscillospiraceae bacterium]